MEIKCNSCLKLFEGDTADKIISLCPGCSKAMDKHIERKKENGEKKC